MTETDAYEAIAQHFATKWAALHPVGSSYVPLALGNEIFEAADRWVRLSRGGTNSRQATIGAPVRWERHGFASVSLWAPAGDGERALLVMVDEARRVLEGAALAVGDERVRIDTGAASTPIADGKWFTTTVAFEYRFHDEH